MLHDIKLQIVVNASVDVVTEIAQFLPGRSNFTSGPAGSLTLTLGPARFLFACSKP
jgi:hypothetical protein